MRASNFFLLSFVFALVLCGCGDVLVPRPEGYPRFDFPALEYRVLDTVALPYVCEIPVYSELSLRGDGKGHDLDFPQYRATLYLTYFDASGPGMLDSLYEDARRLAYKHTVRADGIEERVWSDAEHGVYGVYYKLYGPVATSVQFYLSDSVRHFLRGVLYFFSKPNADSLSPAIERYGSDIEHMIETLRWRSEGPEMGVDPFVGAALSRAGSTAGLGDPVLGRS